LVLRFSESEGRELEKANSASPKKKRAAAKPQCRTGKGLSHLWVWGNDGIECRACKKPLPREYWPDPMGFSAWKEDEDGEWEEMISFDEFTENNRADQNNKKGYRQNNQIARKRSKRNDYS
jgi:hypothetical protein